MRRRLLASITAALVGVNLIPQAASSAESLQVADRSITCNVVGNGSSNDCISQRHVRDVADRRLELGERLSMRAKVHPDLIGVPLDGQVQVRVLDDDGVPASAWVTARTFSWTPGAGKRPQTTRHLTARPVALPGLFQVRLQVTPRKEDGRGTVQNSSRSSQLRAEEPMTSDPTTLIANAQACVEANGQEACASEIPPCAYTSSCGYTNPTQEPENSKHLEDIQLCESPTSCEPPK